MQCRVGMSHLKYSAPETILKPPKYLRHEFVQYDEKCNCFTVRVIAWEFVPAIHAFDHRAENSAYPAANVTIWSYPRKSTELSNLWVQLAAIAPNSPQLDNVHKILGRDFESNPCRKESLAECIAFAFSKIEQRKDENQYYSNSQLRMRTAVLTCRMNS